MRLGIICNLHVTTTVLAFPIPSDHPALCYTNLPRIDPSPFIGPANPFPVFCIPFCSSPSTPVAFFDIVVVVEAVRAGFRTGSSNGKLIIERSDSDKLKIDEVYERN